MKLFTVQVINENYDTSLQSLVIEKGFKLLLEWERIFVICISPVVTLLSHCCQTSSSVDAIYEKGFGVPLANY